MFFLVFCTGQAWADSWQGTASARLSTEYDTNPALTPIRQGGIWRTQLDPAYTLTGKVGENDLVTGIALQVSRASNKALSPDRDSPSLFLNWLRPSEAGEFGISSRYSEMATRDSGGADAAGRVPAASTRTSRTVSGRWNKELSERTTVAADTSYEGVAYKGGNFTDYSTRTGGLRISNVVSEQTSVFCRLSGNNYVPANGGSSSNLVDVALGMSWTGEYMDWAMQAGKTKVDGGRVDNQGSIDLHYNGRQSRLALNAGRTVASSGLGGFARTDQFRANWSYALSESSNTGIDLERRRTIPTIISAANSGSSAGVWMDHILTSGWGVRTYFQHRLFQGAGGEASSDMVGLAFSYSNSNL